MPFLRMLLVVLCLLTPVSLPGQGQFAFKVYGAEHGLDTSTLSCLAFDREGTFWVGSEDGLFRWRGGRFERIRGLRSNYIVSMVAPAEGGLWVLTSHETRFWDGTAFRTPSERGIPDAENCLGYPSSLPQAIIAPGQGVIFLTPKGLKLATGNPGCLEIPEDPSTFLFTTWTFDAERKGVLFFSGNTLYRWQAGRMDQATLPWNAREMAVTALPSPDGRIWIRTSRTLRWMRGFAASFGEMPGKDVVLDLANNYPELAVDREGGVWTSTAQGVVGMRQGQVVRLDERSGLPHPGGSFRVAVDPEGALWIGTERLLCQQGRFLWEYYTRSQGLPSSLVWRTSRDGAGRLWAATQAGAARLEGDRWIPDPATRGTGLYVVRPGAEGDLFFGGSTGPEGEPQLWHLPKGGLRLQPMPLESRFGVLTILDLLPDGPDRIWIATSERGLLQAVRTRGRWRAEAAPWGEPPQDRLFGAFALVRGRDGSLWQAGDEGVVRWDGRTLTRFGAAEGLPSASGLALAEAPDGSVWVAFHSVRQISIFRQAQGRWQVEHLREDHPFARDAVYAMAFAPDGLLVLATARGVKRWDGQTLVTFDTDWGLPGRDCAQLSLSRDPNGDWWVGTASGLAHYRADQERPMPPTPSLDLVDLVDGRGKLLPLDQALQQGIPARDATVKLVFDVRGRLGAQGMRPQVRVIGLDEVWRDLEGSSLLLTGLPHGTYRIETRLTSWDGRMGPQRAWTLRIHPPWYHRWWARTLGAMVLAALVWGGHALRVLRLRRQQAQLELMVQERTAALSEANEALASVLAEVKTLRGLVPICSYCKKVRRDDGFWHQVERVLAEHTEATFSHGICPDCAETVRKEWTES